jgi:hypothetical protein
MTRLCPHISNLVPLLMLSGAMFAGPLGCAVMPSEDGGLASSDQEDQVISGEDIADPSSSTKPDELATRAIDPGRGGGQTNLLGAFDIGVIPATRSCPSSSEAIVINMDDEDRRNANNRGGWIGAIISNSNTSFLFCRVDGQTFRSLTTQFTATQDHYAVLRLGTSCPNNSLPFARGFDNEDTGNANSFSGTITPNVSNSNTTLHFCLFRSDAVTMTSFPNLGFSYGVFAASNFSRRLASGFVHTDDEDSSNANSYSADPAWSGDAQRIVSAGGNTTLNLARVR